MAGKYNNERIVQTFHGSTLTAGEVTTPPASVTHPGIWAQDADGNVYLSAQTS